MQEFKLNNFELNRQAFANAINSKRNRKSGKRLYVSAIHKRLNKNVLKERPEQ